MPLSPTNLSPTISIACFCHNIKSIINYNNREARMIKKRFNQMTPIKQLHFLTRFFFVFTALFLVLVFSSLVITASNLMITNQLNTQTDLDLLSDQYPLYIVSQKMMIGLDVVIMLMVSLLIFSVFHFRPQGNFIIIIVVLVLFLVRWIGGLMFLLGSGSLRQAWDNLWQASEYGSSPLCLNEACKQSTLNYVLCGKLDLWKQLMHFQIIFSILAVILVAGSVVLSHFTNKWDLKINPNGEEDRQD